MWWLILSVGGIVVVVVVVVVILHTCGGSESLISTDSDRGALGVRCSPVYWPKDTRPGRGHAQRGF